jgi:hypothetical protein
MVCVWKDASPFFEQGKFEVISGAKTEVDVIGRLAPLAPHARNMTTGRRIGAEVESSTHSSLLPFKVKPDFDHGSDAIVRRFEVQVHAK